MANEQIASQVLDYWFAIEFLGQDSYDSCTDESKLTRELAKFMNVDSSEKKKRKQITVFEKLDENADIYSIIKKRAKACEMSTWGNLTFYIGKIKRQTCIEVLARELNIKLEQAEENVDYIPVLSFQCTNQGVFIKHSLSLSTIVWALSQVIGKKGVQMSELLSERGYAETLKELEKKYFNVDYSTEAFEQNESYGSIENGGTPIFESDSITIKKIINIHSDIINTYGKYVGEDSIVQNNGVKYQLFKDAKAKDKYDDDNYMGLSHDFFSADLKMVKNYIAEKRYDFSSGMLSDLISYICAPYDKFEKKERHDLVKPKNKDVFLCEMSEILNLRNAPLGKWPSRYMPALMQQVAVNFAISNKSRGILGENGQIFSVNGPPGTGKTTLLKEVIASNVVEKAIVLSQYDTPDEAFDGVKFIHGEFNGAYAQYYPKWFKFKDDRVADYGVLVASCNNIAVENITKELPLGKDILDNLKVVTGGDNSDSTEMRKQLDEIRKLFSAEETEKKIAIYQKDSSRQGEYPEIYFTGYAQKFLGTGDDDADAWGLAAVPLGKKSNISGFYYDVLNPIWQDFMIKNQYIEERLPLYQSSRKEFLTQLKKVLELQKQLGKYGDITLEAHNVLMHSNQTAQQNTAQIVNMQARTVTVNEELTAMLKQVEKDAANVKNIDSVCEEIKQRINEYQQKMKELSDQELEYRRQAAEVENSVTFLTKLFRKSKYNAAIELAQTYGERAKACANNSAEVTQLVESEKKKNEEAMSKKASVTQQLNVTQNKIKELNETKVNLNVKIQKLQAEVETVRQKAEEAKQVRDNLLQVYREAGELKTGQILDEDYIKNVLTSDEEISTEAQTTNPWATEEYNREREKLFFLALQMTKEFLLSSKSCRANLCILGQYWGLRTESGTDKIKFHPEDREAMIGSLFNTLFLLTPVISSTFASVGRLLKDIKTPGVLGTLVIDEAGQAQPQMAVGALFRTRKSIIVGDPKQVEPVVTDELKLLKDAYSESVYGNYKDKSLSVQSCADIINPFGTFFDNGTDYPEWVGCPLLVHRRCISPMYEISNRISYDGIMKQRTLLPSSKTEKSFLSDRTQWINITGTENGGGSHYVPEQGELVCRMVNEAFKRSDYPDLYIITPFKSVVQGIRSSLGTYANRNKESALATKRGFGDWLYSNIGTVHKFQGREANEVIFLLGCDVATIDKYAVKSFVNSNIVNVAATRAKYRLYIVGDMKVWRNNQFVNEAKAIIDTLPIENISKIECWEESEEKNKELINQASQLPGASSFVSQIGENEDGEPEYEIDSDEFISTIDEANFLNKDLSEEQYRQFGFASKSEFEMLPVDVKKNLLMGMKLYYLLEPVFSLSSDLDASCCGILFCKGMEQYLRKNFVKGLKTRFPDYSIKDASNRMIKLQDARDNDFMIGTIQYILRNKVVELGNYMSLRGETEYSAAWWNSFNDKLKSFAGKRNKCCHSAWFKWQDMQQLLKYEFKEDDSNVMRNPKIGGVFYESEKGKKL